MKKKKASVKEEDIEKLVADTKKSCGKNSSESVTSGFEDIQEYIRFDFDSVDEDPFMDNNADQWSGTSESQSDFGEDFGEADATAEEMNSEHSSPFRGFPEMKIEIPESLDLATRYPIIRLDEACAVPFVPMSMPDTFEENEKNLKIAIKKHTPVLLLFQDKQKYVKGTSKGLSRYGIWGRVMSRVTEPNDSSAMMLVIGGPRVNIVKFNTSPNGTVTATARLSEWQMPEKDDDNIYLAALMHEICDLASDVNRLEKRTDIPDVMELFKNVNEIQFISSILFSMSLSPASKNKVLCENSFINVCKSIAYHLGNIKQLLELRDDIHKKVNKKMNSFQRENFIQQQIEMLQNEVGQGSVSDIDKLKERASKMLWREEAKEHFEKELAKLRRFSPTTPDYSIQYSYLDTLLSLPWDNLSEVTIDLDKIEETLNEDHFGLERVKERILEQMAVAALRNDNKSPILCLVGPPGVGKTSLGKSIARAMGREYGRVAFGGLHDEAEIRGHRRTYISAMPGRIIAALQKTHFSNPVIVLDEIDKIGQDYKGDPSTALLEVLDPEQNSHFHDNFIDIDYDLSRILFIATANSLDTISGPLRDRMEIISIPGYIAEEKVEIAKRHLVKKQLEANGLQDENISFTDDALNYIIEYFTRESGVRRLEKVIGKVLRKLAVKKVRGVKYPTLLTRKDISNLLGKEEFNPEMYENNDNVGVVTGLAWTQAGGEILFIESTVTEGKGNLTLTGNLGDVMKESATLSLQYLKSHSQDLGLEPGTFDSHNTHIHVPEGAIPKDGPSAGITMATSLASSFTGRKVRPNIAMTGEITLRGKVLPVGGIREKIIAAKRSGITEIILSKDNEKDILEVKPDYLKGLTFTYVDSVSDVLRRALL